MSGRSAKSKTRHVWKRNMITAEIITIGSELLKGSTLNTNAQFLSRELTQLGFSVNLQISCDDQIYAIATHLGQALLRSDVIIVTGGLGPTPDDVTRDALAQYFKVPLLFSKSQYGQIKKLYGRHLLKVPALVRKEAMYPENAIPLINRFGIALGFYIPLRQKILIALPGVPRELESMMLTLIKPLLKRFFPDLETKPKIVARTVGVSEPEVMRKLGKSFFKDNFEFGIYPETGEVALRIYADHQSIIDRLSRHIRKKLRDSLYALEEISLSAAVGKLLQSRNRTLAVAESCTGGLLSSEITRIAGASRYFKAGSQPIAMKSRWLSEFLKRHCRSKALFARRSRRDWPPIFASG
ncbi:MAG: molybdopterin-binding protein [Candidatus Omnitrophica bacterium]|nr:molybdopterin-binding protein [Candidatus Omnitrophota bacterium]